MVLHRNQAIHTCPIHFILAEDPYFLVLLLCEDCHFLPAFKASEEFESANCESEVTLLFMCSSHLLHLRFFHCFHGPIRCDYRPDPGSRFWWCPPTLVPLGGAKRTTVRGTISSIPIPVHLENCEGRFALPRRGFPRATWQDSIIVNRLFLAPMNKDH